MTKREKLIEKIRNNPKNVRFEQIDSLLTYYGFERKQPGTGSSHFGYKLDQWKITVSHRKPFIHSKTVRQVISRLDEIIND